MDKDTIIRLANEVGIRIFDPECMDVITYEELTRFATLIAAEEREACAKAWFKEPIEVWLEGGAVRYYYDKPEGL